MAVGINFDLTVFVLLLMIYGIVRATLFFRKTGDWIYVVVLATLIIGITNSWIETYGGRVADLYRAYSAAFNLVPLGIFFAYLYLENQRKKEREEKEKVRGFFGKYVSEKIVNELLTEKAVHVGGQRREVTVLYTDVRGFTSMSEKLPAEEVVHLLNEHFNVLTKIAFKHGGTVDKFIGDAVMVIFGAPIHQKDHALRAVRCGIEMQKGMADLNKKLKREGREVNIGVSINTGDAVIGNIGSEQFVDYTAVGDTVNTASRMQSAAGAGEVVISEGTLKQVRQHVRVTKKEKMVAKGKAKPVIVYKIRVE